MKITDRSQIPQALSYIKQQAEEQLKDSRDHSAAMLVCEEMLVHLAEAGYRSVSVEAKRRHGFLVVIRAEGKTDGLFFPSDELRKPATLEQELNRNLLEQYDNRIEYSYRRGENRYLIFFDHATRPDLSRELSEFYEAADGNAGRMPLELLKMLAKKHPRMMAFALIGHFLKHGAALTLPIFASNIIDLIGAGTSFFSLEICLNIGLSILALAVNLVLAWLINRYFHAFTRSVESSFKMAVVQKIQMLSMKYHSGMPTGTLLSKLVSDVQFIQILLYDLLPQVLYLGMDILWVICLSLIRMPVMLLFFTVILPVYAMITLRSLRAIWKSKTTLRKDTELSNAAFKEMLQNEKLTRSHGLQRTEYQGIASKVRKVQLSAGEYDRLQLNLNSTVYGLTQGFRLVCLCVAVYLAANGTISIGAVVLFLSLFDAVITSMQKVLDQLPQITQGYDSLVSVNEILLEKDNERNGTKLLPEPVRGEIELKHVTFGYDEDQPPVLKDASLWIPAGKSVALVGSSGSGKTTILNLILGLYSAWSGEVLIDGINVDELEKTAYRHRIAVVPQTTVLFSGTLWENLVYGMRYVTADRVMDALERVGLQELVTGHPEGLNRPVYENGENFSGGQRQRIAIVRALLRNPRIILFDEATSALDEKSERQVQQAINAVMGTCTVVMVAHRLNTLRRADILYRIDQEGVTRYASYDEMMKEEGSQEN